jgi:RHS repeat-associated protein
MSLAASKLSRRTHGENRRPLRQRASGRSFIYNLRFPGQYYQAETGLNYNYFRDYDPQTGRYVEGDPIGLYGGSFSIYSYVNNSPLNRSDPFGLRLTVVGNTPSEQTALQNALNIVRGTPRGNEVIQTLENSPTLYLITNQQNGNAYYDDLTHVISVDPGFNPPVNVIRNTSNSCAVDRELAPTSIVLGHELGHAVRGDPRGHSENELPNIIQNENPIRLQLGLPTRTSW